MRARGLRPIPASPAIPLAGRGFRRLRVRRRQVPGTVSAIGLCRPRSSGTSDAVPLPGGARSGRAGRPCPRAGRSPGRLPRLIAPASAVPTVHRGPRARSRARRWSPAAAPAGQPKQTGVEIRTGVEVAQIRIKDGLATGVVLASGEEISARAVVSNADPKRTLMRLVDPAHLAPDFIQKIMHYRCLGTVAKINLAICALPEFTALKSRGDDNLLKGRIQISPEID